ncbi:MAG: glutaredoxin domain-containing protein [Spirochaetota bacterium]
MYSDIPYKKIEGRRGHDSVYVYGLSFCDHCKAAIEFLKEEGFSFHYVYLDRIRGEYRRRVTADLEAIWKQKLIYPILEVGGEFTFGFDEESWRSTIGSAEHSPSS